MSRLTFSIFIRIRNSSQRVLPIILWNRDHIIPLRIALVYPHPSALKLPNKFPSIPLVFNLSNINSLSLLNLQIPTLAKPAALL